MYDDGYTTNIPACLWQASLGGATEDYVLACDGTIVSDLGQGYVTQEGTWSLTGSTLNLDVTEQAFTATCTKQ